MSSTQLFLLINVIGGISVLGSYFICLAFYPEFRTSLWGGVDGSLRKLFTASMLPAAIGYLVFFYFMVFKLDTGSFENQTFWRQHGPSMICLIFLTASTVWMPATISYLTTSNQSWWLIAVASLWISAVSLIVLIPVIYWGTITVSPLYKYLGILGLLYITFHCTVLDALIWVAKFPKLH